MHYKKNYAITLLYYMMRLHESQFLSDNENYEWQLACWLVKSNNFSEKCKEVKFSGSAAWLQSLYFAFG